MRGGFRTYLSLPPPIFPLSGGTVSGWAHAGAKINFAGCAVSVSPRVSAMCSGCGKSNE